MKNILEQLKPSNISIKKQIVLLAQYLIENFDYEMRGEGAIEMVIRLLEEYRNARPINNLL